MLRIPLFRCWKWVTCTLVAGLFVLISVIGVIDYQRLNHLRTKAIQIKEGSTKIEVSHLLGDPDDIGTGETNERNGLRVKTSVWFYRTNFDWDGIRTRWNNHSLLPYWYSRLSPSRDQDVDDVVILHLANDIVVDVLLCDRDKSMLFRRR